VLDRVFDLPKKSEICGTKLQPKHALASDFREQDNLWLTKWQHRSTISPFTESLWSGLLAQIRVTVSQIAIGLPCLANLLLGTFSVAWFTLVAIAGDDYLKQLNSVCNAVTALYVWTSVLYLAGSVPMASRQGHVKRAEAGAACSLNFRAVGKLSEIFCSKLHVLKHHILKTFRDKIKIMSTHNVFCRKCAAVCRNSVRNWQCVSQKIATFCPA